MAYNIRDFDKRNHIDRKIEIRFTPFDINTNYHRISEWHLINSIYVLIESSPFSVSFDCNLLLEYELLNKVFLEGKSNCNTIYMEYFLILFIVFHLNKIIWEWTETSLIRLLIKWQIFLDSSMHTSLAPTREWWSKSRIWEQFKKCILLEKQLLGNKM